MPYSSAHYATQAYKPSSSLASEPKSSNVQHLCRCRSQSTHVARQIISYTHTSLYSLQLPTSWKRGLQYSSTCYLLRDDHDHDHDAPTRRVTVTVTVTVTSHHIRLLDYCCILYPIYTTLSLLFQRTNFKHLNCRALVWFEFVYLPAEGAVLGLLLAQTPGHLGQPVR